MNNQIHIVQRGCGWPRVGKIYASILSDEKGGFYGSPIYNFLLCPPQPINNLLISAQGMTCISRGQTNSEGKEIFDVFDWIGASNYPNVADWVEELHFGFHQLVERTFPFEKLVPESCYFPVHPRAGIGDAAPYFVDRQEVKGVPVCPKGHEQHTNPSKEFLESHPAICTGLLWNDIIEGEKIEGRKVLRKMPSFTYEGFSAPAESLAGNDNHYPAFFMKIPIGRIGNWLVYEDTKQHTEQEALKELEKLDQRLKRVQIVQL